MRTTLLAAALTLALAAPTLHAQTAPPGAPAAPAAAPAPGAIAAHPDWPHANPQDVSTIPAIIASLYDVISGPAEKPRDWDRMRSLFIPQEGRLVVTRVPRSDAPAGSRTDVTFLTVDQYVARFTAGTQKNGFFEHGISSRVDTYGEMSNVWTTYESRHTAADPAPFARGINSVELLHSGDRYYIVQVYWDSERPTNPIPAKYLGGGK